MQFWYSTSNANFFPGSEEAAPEPEELREDGADDAVYHKKLQLPHRRDLGENNALKCIE